MRTEGGIHKEAGWANTPLLLLLGDIYKETEAGRHFSFSLRLGVLDG